MNLTHILFFLTILTLIPTAPVQAQDGSEPDSLGSESTRFPPQLDSSAVAAFQKSVTLVGEGFDTTYFLGEIFLVPESETALFKPDRVLQRGLEYTVDYRTGIIQFAYILPKDAEVEVLFQFLPFDLQPSYTHRELDTLTVETDSADVEKIVVRKTKYDAYMEESDLKGSGSIVRGITVGSNQDLTINSGLNLQISGNLTKDVTITASLTDENTPIQPEGNTQTLEEVDKVFIEARKGDEVAVTFGDFALELNNQGPDRSEFGKYSRKLQGVKAAIDYPTVSATTSVASTRGKFTTNEVVVSEGIQGPYQLRGEGGESDIIVIAGTEHVWIDGVLMTRGEDNDYVIDYGAGELTFTENRLIRSESRVIADFEYSNETFTRNTFGNTIVGRFFDKRLVIGGTFIREADDREDPVNLSLSDSLITQLSEVDDDTLQEINNVVFVSGEITPENGRGTYNKIADPSASAGIRYVYVGSDSTGEVNVRFTDFGPGRGEYRRGDILGEFVFVGMGNGDYLPLVPLELPTTAIMGTVFANFRPRENLLISSELALSDFDKNAFSEKSTSGRAYTVRSELLNQETGIGKIDLFGRFRHLDKDFRPIDRINIPEYNRYWNLSSEGGFLKEDVLDFRTVYRPITDWSFSGQFARLDRGPDFNSTRYAAGTNLAKQKYPFVRYDVEVIDSESRSGTEEGGGVLSEGEVIRQFLFSDYSFSYFKPGIDYEFERNVSTRVDSTFGTRYNTYRPKFEFIKIPRTRLGGFLEIRVDESLNNRVDSLDQTVSTATTQNYFWGLQDWKSISISTNVTHRVKRFKNSFKTNQNLDKKTTLVNADLSYFPLKRALFLNVKYQISDEQIQNRKIVFLDVGENNGDYTQENDGDFVQVNSGEGEFIRRTIRDGSFTPIVELRIGMRLKFQPLRMVSKDPSNSGGFFEKIKSYATDTFFKIEENQRNPNRGFYFLDFREIQDDSTLQGNYLFRQDLFAFEDKPNTSLRLRYELFRSLNNQFTDGNERRTRQLGSVRLRNRLSFEYSLENELEVRSDQKDISGNTASLGADFDIISYRASTALTYRPKFYVILTNGFSYKQARDRTGSSTVKARVFRYTPNATYSFRNKGRLTGQVDFSRVFLDPKSGSISFELTDGNKAGWTFRWLLNGDYRVNKNVTASLSYSGRKEPSLPVIHLGTLEVRAFF